MPYHRDQIAVLAHCFVLEAKTVERDDDLGIPCILHPRSDSAPSDSKQTFQTSVGLQTCCVMDKDYDEEHSIQKKRTRTLHANVAVVCSWSLKTPAS